ncbi:PREDICTED: dystroglycan-like [Calidris pugnax]|uniref:dystroglycan-like n=1 Tax=Calidris pugnax TaxID=198806 RepID=UPI00071DF7C1|nr:PREDICTED: dystroglycan-like [Calidris pugnax]
MDPCGDPVGTHSNPPASGAPLVLGTRVLPLLPLLLALVPLCVNTPAAVAKGSNNPHEETKSLQGIPDATVLLGKIFHYPVPGFAFQGRITQYKVTLASGADLPKWLDFNPSTNTLQGLPMAGESGVYLLNIAAPGRTHAPKTPRAAGNFTIHVQDDTFFLDTEESLKLMPNSYQCGKEVPITSAEIILSTGAETLGAQERLYIVHTMAEYLHLDSSLLTLLQYRDSAHRGSQSLTVLAEDSGHLDFGVNHYVGLSWPVKCGGFAALHEFIQVLQHNVDSHHLSQLLGYEIAGWRILRRGDYERKSPRRQRRQLRITPTPTLKLTGITQRSVAGDASRPLSSTVPSHLLTQLVVLPTQSLPSFGEESITMASFKMDIFLHLVSQESLLTLEMNSTWDMPTNPPASIMFADSSFPDLSPSLTTKTLLFNEPEVLPTGASGMSLLVEQLKPHVPEMDSYFLSSKSEVSTYHFLQDVTSDTDQLSRPMYTWVINTLHEWPHSSAEAFPSKTEFHVFLSGAMSVSEVPDYSKVPELEMLASASLSPETVPLLFPKASVRATTLPDFTLPIDDTFPPVLASGSLSQLSASNYDQLSKPLMTTPLPNGFPFAGGKSPVSPVTQKEAQTLHPKLNFSHAASACFSNTLHGTSPSKAEAPCEPRLITLSHSDSTPALTLPTNTLHSSYGGSMLRPEMQSASVLSSSTKEWYSDRDLETRRILPIITEPTLESHNISAIKLDAAEAPLETLFNSTSYVSSSIPGVAQTLLPSHQDPSTLLFPTSGRPQSVDSTWILPPFSVSQELQNITPGQANTSPKVVHSIKFLTATIGCLFFFPIPANTFYDEEDGNSTRLSLQIVPADGSPWGSESWLQFNTSQQTMHGYPLEIDLQYSPQEFVLSATDSGGLTARESFTVDLLKTTDVPCHLYTVRTKNSYYSFLRERKRISLFLEKLSLYLNSSSPQDIVVTALKPGSTVISWYNRSLCTSANTSSCWCAKDEIQEALEKLRVPGGHVSPHFVQAMLPEYKIEVIFNISYSKVCFSSTKPFNGSFSSTVPTLQDKNDTRIRKTPSALLSSLCVTVGVVLMLLVYWFCKCHRKIPRPQSVTFQRNSHLSHANVELDVLKPHKAPVQECRASLSPQLWIPPSPSLISHKQYSRSIPLPHIIPSFQPPKYQLPPCYQEGTTTQNDQGNIY